MNTKINQSLDLARENYANTFSHLLKIERILAPIVGKLSESPDVNPYGSSLWLTVDNREDLEVVLSLAPQWTKYAGEGSIYYQASVNGVPIRIEALQGALPPTCKLVPEEYEIPAQEAKPATRGTRMVLKCDPVPAENADIEADENPAINPAQAIP